MMKKSIVVLSMMLVLFSCLCLGIRAREDFGGYVACDNLQEYEEFLKLHGESESFVTYHQLSVFGEFVHFSATGSWIGPYTGGRLERYVYRFIDENQREIEVNVELLDMSSFESPAQDLAQYCREALISGLDVRSFSTLEDDMIMPNCPSYEGFTAAFIGNAAYLYKNQDQGKISHIAIYTERVRLVISGIRNYPSKRQESMITRLTTAATCVEAINEVRARVNGTFASEDTERNGSIDKTASKRETWIVACVSIAVASLATWSITFLVMRKKRGKPVPATAGAPTGEVLAGSDGDDSTAPAAPESPAPPESPTPPEGAATEDMAAEDTAPEETPPPDN